MSRYNSYFLMKEDDVENYIKEKLDLFKPDDFLSVKEVGDGNLNHVFRAVGPAGKSVIIKQAGKTLRIPADKRVSTDRNRLESDILIMQNKCAPGLVPKVYIHDPVMCAFTMEDLSDYDILRCALMERKTFPRFAQDITDYLINTLLNSTDAVMAPKAKKAMVKRFMNPELCEIVEELVFTEPYNDIMRRNIVTPSNAEFVRKELYDDAALHLEAAKLKSNFMNNVQSLIHGDLHTGSIFVKADSTRVFDPEFAHYGPMGYDLGNLAANLFFAWNFANARDDEEFCEWILETAANIIDLFKAKFKAFYCASATEPMAKTTGFCEYLLDMVIEDTAGYAGTELIRRTVGVAQAKDITDISDERHRAAAERINIHCGKDLIMNRSAFRKGTDFTAALRRAAETVKHTSGFKNI